jgi:amino acid adenylation domain-containing protein
MSDAGGSTPGAVLSWNDASDNIPLDWNGPVDRVFDVFPDEAKARPIIELLEASVRRFPERVAIVDSAASMTYTEIWRASAALAEQIAAATAPGDWVGILAPVSAASSIAMLACLAAGRPFVALDPQHPREWLQRALDDTRPNLLLVAGSDHGVVAEIPCAPRTLDLNSNTRRASPGWRPACLSADEPACILFTSGSTGQPKSVVNSQRNLLQRVSQSINAAHINSDDRFLTLTSLCTIVGVRDLVTALVAGACTFLLDTQKAGAREILRVIRDRRISILFAFPALLRSVVEASEGGAGRDLRMTRIGGDTTLWSDISLLRAWMSPGTSIQLIYAATEAPMMQWFVGEIARGEDERIPIGYALPGNTVAVVDENGAPTPDGEVGELLVRSPYVALGSGPRGRPEPGNIRTDVGDRTMRILNTGDLVRRRPDGLYDRVGRKDRQVKIRGERVELEGVEAAIRRQTGVRDVGVIARTYGDHGTTRLVAYVQLRDGASSELLKELQLMMRQSVPPPMLPWRFYAMPSIPRLPNSKLDVRTLQAIDRTTCAAEVDSCLRPPDGTWNEKDRVETAVARIWRDVLGLRLAAPGDDFFDLGGDSLRAITMTCELEKALGRELPMNLIHRAPTFAAFCATLREKGPLPYSPLVVLKRGRTSPALFFVHGVGGCVMELSGLCRKIPWSGPVIGIQARGLDGRDPPHDSVDAMVSEYLEAVKAYQKEGPYLLCGYSFGGLVAFELARRLRDGGDEVAFVGMFATLPPGHHFLRAWTWAAYLYRRFRTSADRVRTEKRLRTPAVIPSSALRAVATSALSASTAYRGRSYGGELTIFEPGSRDFGVPSSARHWSRYASRLRHYSLQGRHDDMFVGANADAAAALLARCLEAAVSRSESRARKVGPPPRRCARTA